MKVPPEHIEPCHYDYANKCDCAEDDKCGCDYPNNLPHDFSIECLNAADSEKVATDAPMVTSAFDDLPDTKNQQAPKQN